MFKQDNWRMKRKTQENNPSVGPIFEITLITLSFGFQLSVAAASLLIFPSMLHNLYPQSFY